MLLIKIQLTIILIIRSSWLVQCVMIKQMKDLNGFGAKLGSQSEKKLIWEKLLELKGFETDKWFWNRRQYWDKKRFETEKQFKTMFQIQVVVFFQTFSV